MCGICGWITPPTADAGERDAGAAVVRAMSDSLRHRGPDGEGLVELRSLDARRPLHGWFGHRRLKVVDPTHAADQPMTSEDGAVALTFNGEIYNFRALRRELEAAGHRFRSSGDTEVVLHAYLEWGDALVDRLDGMFAFAIWDARRGRLLLARDRIGKKPLFYTLAGGRLTFGSEIKALLAAPWVEPRPALARLPEYLTYGYVPGPDTFYEGIRQVPPAATVAYGADGLEGPIEYWTPLPDGPLEPPSADLGADIARLLVEATERRMVADVPLGALLSGGIDSSLVVGLMSRVAREPVLTFSAGFPDDPSYDERRWARVVAERFGTRHTEFTVEADAVALMDRLLWHHDQPYADSSAIPTYLVSRLAREHVTVVLNGDGGDEVFGGYERFAAAAASRRLPAPVASAALAAARRLPRDDGYHSLRRRAERLLETTHLPLADRYLAWIAVFNTDAVGELLGRAAHDAAALAAPMNRCYERAAALPPLDRILYANFRTYLPDDLCVKMDRMSMASSLEARSPFLDTALVERMARVPARRKVGVRRLKPLLRQALGPLLPREIWERRKHGFGVPMGHWFRHDLGAVFEDEVLTPGAATATVFDAAVLGRLWDEHRRGERDHGPRFWTILTLERWLRSGARPPAPEPPREAIVGASEG